MIKMPDSRDDYPAFVVLMGIYIRYMVSEKGSLSRGIIYGCASVWSCLQGFFCLGNEFVDKPDVDYAVHGIDKHVAETFFHVASTNVVE